ncbi:MAG: uracil-DNA glycosylase [Elusimicrobia bacterium]|nr:uracil-DNA glycosylase [Elusimicrobiota bacterium]
MADELLELTRRLRRRVEQSHRSLWKAGASSEPQGRVADGRTRPGAADNAARLAQVAREVESCRRCPLGSTRLKAVPGTGSSDAQVLFVGEGPGFAEDRRGEPFVGPAGELLDRILAAIGLSRSTVYIANIVKCHPMKDPGAPEARGNDRPPTPEEMAACRPHLAEQIRILAPRCIVALGAVAARALLCSEAPIGRLRGTWGQYRDGNLAVKVLPTYHPAALLRDPELKKLVWQDMKALRMELESAPQA